MVEASGIQSDCPELKDLYKTFKLIIGDNMTSEEVRAELKGMAYDRATYNQVIDLVWNPKFDNSFWYLVCRRLIATIIVGIQE